MEAAQTGLRGTFRVVKPAEGNVALGEGSECLRRGTLPSRLPKLPKLRSQSQFRDDAHGIAFPGTAGVCPAVSRYPIDS